MATEMYSLPPIYNLNAKVDLPTCMYSLPVIQSSAGENIQAVESSSSSSAGAGYMDALEKRQDSILARLGQLKDQVSAYKQSIGLGPIPDVKPATNAKGSGCIADIVIKASPSRPPHSLPTALAVLQSNGYAVFMSTHIHSSVTTGANKLKAFLPPTVSGLSRSLADVRVTFIWAEVSGECELIVSPLTQSVIKGEVNILRYLARVFDDEFVYENSNNVASLDCMLDTISSLPYAVPKNRPPMLRSVTSGLPKVFNGDDITVVDLALFSYLKQGDQGGNLPQEVKKWMEGMTKWSEEMMSSDEGKKRSPRRRNYRRSHRTSHNHKEGPPEKKHRESEKEKSPKKEKSPQKSIKEEKGKENTPPSGHMNKAQLFTFLEKNKIKYNNVEHPEVFTVEAMMPYLENVEGAICKNLFLKDKKGGLYLLSAAHDREVKLNDVAKKVGAKELRFGAENVMLDTLGVSQGCVTAFSLVNDKARKVKFIVDSSLLDGSFKMVNFHPMVNTDTTGISTQDFNKFLQITGHQILKF